MPKIKKIALAIFTDLGALRGVCKPPVEVGSGKAVGFGAREETSSLLLLNAIGD